MDLQKQRKVSALVPSAVGSQRERNRRAVRVIVTQTASET